MTRLPLSANNFGDILAMSSHLLKRCLFYKETYFHIVLVPQMWPTIQHWILDQCPSSYRHLLINTEVISILSRRMQKMCYSGSYSRRNTLKGLVEAIKGLMEECKNPIERDYESKYPR